AYRKTYGLRSYVSRCTNNYGPYQLPEKFIPKIIIRASLARSIPIYGSGIQVENSNIAKQILTVMGKPHSLIEHVQDRPGHDRRYRLDTSKVRRLGWKPIIGFDEGLKETVSWYLQHASWWRQTIDEKILSPAPWKENW